MKEYSFSLFHSWMDGYKFLFSQEVKMSAPSVGSFWRLQKNKQTYRQAFHHIKGIVFNEVIDIDEIIHLDDR